MHTFLPRLASYSILIPSNLMHSMMGLLVPKLWKPLTFFHIWRLLKEVFEDTVRLGYKVYCVSLVKLLVTFRVILTLSAFLMQYGRTSLHLAASNGSLEVVRHLCLAGVNIDAVTNVSSQQPFSFGHLSAFLIFKVLQISSIPSCLWELSSNKISVSFMSGVCDRHSCNLWIWKHVWDIFHSFQC